MVLMVGARQVGKTTLVQSMARGPWPARYVSLDDRTVLDSALTNPDGFIREAKPPLIIDEVQRAPDLLRAIKRAVDRDPKPGRFLLTASADLMGLGTALQGLVGQVVTHRLYPLSWSERLEREPSGIIDLLFSAQSPRELLETLPGSSPPERTDEIRRLLLSGGFPIPALMDSEASRRAWFEDYRQSYIERDLRNLANLQNVPDFNRLMTTLAQRTSHILNLSELARDVSLPVTTVRRYFYLLDQTYQIGTLAACSTKGGKRLVKRPKLYVHDTGTACHLGAIDGWEDLERRSRVGALVETWIQWELKKLLSLAPNATQLTYWRAQPGREVNFLLERGGDAIGIEVTWSATFGRRNLVGLNTCRQSWGEGWRLAVLLHGGTEAVALDEHTVALPFGVFFGREG